MVIHNCLRCEHSQRFDKPISMLTSEKVHMSFLCKNPDVADCYGRYPAENIMIWEIDTNKCWVDGSETIPVEGCANFKKDMWCNER